MMENGGFSWKVSSLWVSSPRLLLINLLCDCFVTSGTKIHTASHSYMYVSTTPKRNHAATCITAGRCVHKVKTPDWIFHRYIVLFKTFFFFFVIYIFDFNQVPHGQLHVLNVCLLFIHRIKLSSTLNISRLSQQTPSPIVLQLYWPGYIGFN